MAIGDGTNTGGFDPGFRESIVPGIGGLNDSTVSSTASPQNIVGNATIDMVHSATVQVISQIEKLSTELQKRLKLLQDSVNNLVSMNAESYGTFSGSGGPASQVSMMHRSVGKDTGSDIEGSRTRRSRADMSAREREALARGDVRVADQLRQAREQLGQQRPGGAGGGFGGGPLGLANSWGGTAGAGLAGMAVSGGVRSVQDILGFSGQLQMHALGAGYAGGGRGARSIGAAQMGSLFRGYTSGEDLGTALGTLAGGGQNIYTRSGMGTARSLDRIAELTPGMNLSQAAQTFRPLYGGGAAQNIQTAFGISGTPEQRADEILKMSTGNKQRDVRLLMAGLDPSTQLFQNVLRFTGGDPQAAQAIIELGIRKAGGARLDTAQHEAEDTQRAATKRSLTGYGGVEAGYQSSQDFAQKIGEIAAEAVETNRLLGEILGVVGGSRAAQGAAIGAGGVIGGALTSGLMSLGRWGLGKVGGRGALRAAGRWGGRAALRAGTAVTSATGAAAVGAAASTAGAYSNIRNREFHSDAAAAVGLSPELADRSVGQDIALQARLLYEQGLNLVGKSSVYDAMQEYEASIGDGIGDAGGTIRTNKAQSHITGLNPEFRSRLEAMFRENPELVLNSGYRSPEHQKRLWEDALRQYGSPEAARKWVAPPGKSNHNRGVAADIGPPSQYGWLAKNAKRFGLELPMKHEPWHVEPSGLRGGNFVGTGSAYDGSASTAGNASGRGLVNYGSGSRVGANEIDIINSFLGGSSGIAGRLGGGDPGTAGGGGYGGGGGGGATGGMALAAQAAYRAGFRGDDLIQMVAIAMAESSGNPGAVGDVSLQNSKWGPSVGLWQIRSLNAQKGTGQERDVTRLKDPYFNAQSAMAVLNQQGWGAWSVYKSGAYKEYLDGARNAVAGIGNGVGDPSSEEDVTRAFSRQMLTAAGGMRGGSGGSSVVINVNANATPADAERLARMVEDAIKRRERMHNIAGGY